MVHAALADRAVEPAALPETETGAETDGGMPPSRRRPPAVVAWFAGLGIRVRIAIGFAVALILLVVVAVAAGIGIQRGDRAFVTYDAIAENGRRIQQFERDIVDLRRNLLLYIERDNPRGLLATRRLEPDLRTMLKEATAAEGNADRHALMEQIQPLLDRTFANLAKAIEARNKMKAINGSQLDVYGPKAHEELLQLIRTAMRSNDMATATEAGLVLDAFADIRLAATRFIGQGDMAMVSEARAKVKAFVDLIDTLKSSLSKPELVQSAEDAEKFARAYETGIVDAANAAQEMNTLIYQTMEDDIAKIADLTQQVRTSELAQLKAEQSGAALAFRATFITVVVLAAAALVLGLLFALLIGRGIANPIAALTEAMAVLAGGDYAAEVPGLARRDEIGRMAAAVQVFRQNGTENERLRRDVESERQAAERHRQAQDDLLGRAVGEIVAAAAAGDLAQRIDTAPLDGVARTLGGGVNRLLDAVAGAIDEVGRVLAGLAEGDLTRRVDGDYAGVFAVLKENVNGASATLAEAMRRIADSANTVRAAAGEISAGSQDLAQRTESQAATLEQTAAAMHEVTATVKQNADNAQAANQLAGVARDTADRGGSVVGAAVAAVSQIEDSAKKIADIVSLIDEIAFQTNLLALNASVEAARAGEAGKGFAVVAQEVRALAQRSANASKDIKGLITASNAQVRSGAQLVNQTGAALGEIVTAVKKVSDIVAEIAAASTEQARGLEEVNGAVVNMDEMTQRNGALVEQTSASAQSLSGQAEELAALLGRFRIA